MLFFVQVADMHGEIIELNERLQKMLNIREHQLRRLREELVNLRGPVNIFIKKYMSRKAGKITPPSMNYNVLLRKINKILKFSAPK